MKIACLTFTLNGEKIGSKIKEKINADIYVYKRQDYEDNLKDFCKNVFSTFDGIIFISSTGIAVRLIAPFIKDKIHDPAVVVVDDLGRYSISLLSGHIGGANKLCTDIAKILNAEPIVTTASDARGIEAVDSFAKRNSLLIENMDDAKKLTAMMVDGRKICFVSEINSKIKYENLVEKDAEGYIYVTSKRNISCDKPACILRPKNLNIGIGCRRGRTLDEIECLVDKTFKQYNLDKRCIKSISTIDVKRDEKGILDLSHYYNCKLNIFSKEQVEEIQSQFKKSEFVKETIGVTSVAEPCAYLAGGSIIVSRQALNGVTMAISKEGI